MGGPGRFASLARQAGFDGFILPDAPLEEARPALDAAAAEQLTASLLIAPTTPYQRATDIAKASSGFVYLLARAGITGEQSQAPDIGGRVARLRQATSLPIAVGFGISSPEHVRLVTEHADAAIVGSALVKRLALTAQRGSDPVGEARTFCSNLVSGLFAPTAAIP
jgi:tryptophan synthase alpha chain